jgi:GAF domain-containing protein
MQLEALQSLALSVAEARSPAEVLKQVVQGLGMTEGVALARVWRLRREPDEEPVLELEASIGVSIASPDVRWNRTDGAHQKIPLSYGKVGHIARSNEPLLLQRGSHDWLMQPEWAQAEGIGSFAGQPLTFRGEVLGVVAQFSRRRLERHDLTWLRVFADHAAVAVANTRAYDQLARLEEHAKRERDYLRAAMRDALTAAGQPPGTMAPKTQVPNGETRDIHRAGRRYVTLVGNNPLFHLPQDRWPHAVDAEAATRIAASAARMVVALTR